MSETTGTSQSSTETSVRTSTHRRGRRMMLIVLLLPMILFFILLVVLLAGQLYSTTDRLGSFVNNKSKVYITKYITTLPPNFKGNNASKDSPSDDEDSEETFHYRDYVYDTIKQLFVVCLLAYLLIVPLAIRSIPCLARGVLFPAISTDIKLKLPKGRYIAVNEFYLTYTDTAGLDIKLGVWHIPPQDDYEVVDRQGQFFGPDRRLVVVMAHGNAGDRGLGRVQYRMLSEQLGCHVVAFDYRGYADSSNVRPTADGLAEDTLAVYQWILTSDVAPNRVIFWGHSLGGAVIMRMLGTLPPNISPLAAILEATFSSLHDEIAEFPFSRPFRCLPYFKYCFQVPIISNRDLNFDSVAALPSVHCPLLLLHALDDDVIPFSLGEKLYEAAKKMQPEKVAKKTVLIDFPAKYGCGHKGIACRPELPYIISKFVLELINDD